MTDIRALSANVKTERSYLNQKILRQFNRRLLLSQQLSSNASGRDSLVSVSRSCCGINSQNFRDSFLSFWAKTKSFTDNDLLSSLKPKGKLTRTWTVRGTVHTFPSKDYYVHVFGSPQNRILGRYDNWAKKLGVPSRDIRIDYFYQPLLDEIKGRSVTTEFIGDFISERMNRLGLKGRMKLDRGWTSETTYGPTWEGIAEMSYMGLLVNAGRKGSGNQWMSTADWLRSGIKVADPDECATKLIRSYIEKYGPVSVSDIAYWSGHRKKEVHNSINILRGDLIVEHIIGETYYSVNNQLEDIPEPPRIIILPRFDSLMMGHLDKTRVFRADRKKHIFTSSGIINPTILLDGFVIGTWKKENHRSAQKITVSHFRELKPIEMKSIEERFADYGDYLKTGIEVKFQPVQ